MGMLGSLVVGRLIVSHHYCKSRLLSWPYRPHPFALYSAPRAGAPPLAPCRGRRAWRPAPWGRPKGRRGRRGVEGGDLNPGPAMQLATALSVPGGIGRLVGLAASLRSPPFAGAGLGLRGRVGPGPPRRNVAVIVAAGFSARGVP